MVILHQIPWIQEYHHRLCCDDTCQHAEGRPTEGAFGEKNGGDGGSVAWRPGM